LAGESRGLDGFFPGLGVGGLEERIRGLARRAEELAGRLGIVVGRVSRYSPVMVEPGGTLEVEVDPVVYFGGIHPFHRVGDYLVIVDVKGETAVLARVRRVERRDLLSLLASHRPADTGYSSFDPSSLATSTIVHVEPLVEAPAGELASGGRIEPVPAVTSIEPQSPVVDPHPRVVERLLSLPGRGVLLGALAGPGGLVKEGRVPVRLPYKALVQHVLVIGTTGSGKTTLLKNMAADAAGAGGEGPVLVFMDMNQDFIQLAFPPPRDQAELLRGDPVYNTHYSRHRPPGSLIVLLPAPARVVEEAGPGDWCARARRIAGMYVEDSLVPILEIQGAEATSPPTIHSTGKTCMVRVGAGPATVYIVPYVINTSRMDTDSLARLMPGLSPLARSLLRRLRNPSRVQGVPSLQEVAAGVYAALHAGRNGGRPDEAVVESLEAYGFGDPEVAMRVFWEVQRGLPHKSTLEALYRRLAGLLDTGLVDVPVGDGLAPEPGIGDVMVQAHAHGAPVVVDLGWQAGGRVEQGVEAPRLVAYRVLDRIRAWKHSLWASRSRGEEARRKIVIVIDEAHQFFPQERGPREEQEASRQVAGMISQIARLGRARGIGLVFATHSPKDLHDIILQLANTKILLRTEKAQAEHLDLPGDVKQVLPRLPDRNMVVLSHTYRENYVMAATSPPVTMHYDISAL